MLAQSPMFKTILFSSWLLFLKDFSIYGASSVDLHGGVVLLSDDPLLLWPQLVACVF